MLKTLAVSVAILLSAACSQQMPAASEAPAAANPAASDAPAAANIERPAPEAAADAFAAALRAGDVTAVHALMADDVVIAESGEVERSFAEYAEHHLPADIAFTSAVTFTPQDRKVIAGGDMATVISRSEVRGSFHGRDIHSNSIETMVLKWTAGAWRIVHIHWSSSPIE